MDFSVKQFLEAEQKLDMLKQVLKIDQIKEELKSLEFAQNQPDFWQADLSLRQKNLDKSAKIIKTLNSYQNILKLNDEIKVALSLIDESTNLQIDQGFKDELQKNFNKFTHKLKNLELISLLSDELDSKGAFLTINSGAGGVEAKDWVLMLSRMYKRWAENQNFLIETVDALSSEEGGFKSMLLQISGDNAFGLLKNETGVHRLVRISPFDAAKRRHTSFASVLVSADIDEDVKITINESDLKIETLRSSKAGGQHVNTTDSAVRITHLPTGQMVKVQKERSQHKNRALALKILKLRLYQLKLDEQKSAAKQKNASLDDNSFGRQIRSYVLYPYQLVKDHESEFETSQAKAVLDGKLDDLILSKLLANKKITNAQNI